MRATGDVDYDVIDVDQRDTTTRQCRAYLLHVESERPMPWEKRVCRRNELAGEFSVVDLNRILSGTLSAVARI